MSKIRYYFHNYAFTREKFDLFHNQVINMPRDSFSNNDLYKLQVLFAYLLLLENKTPEKGFTYRDIMEAIAFQLKQGVAPQKEHKSDEIEKEYFVFTDPSEQYKEKGRMFRHLMGFCAFFGAIYSQGKKSKFIKFDKCREYVLSSLDNLIPVARNNILNLNIKNNDFIKNLSGIKILPEANYRPTYGILKYLQEIKRPATKFELALLLGRIDEVQSEKEIITRALDIGRTLPTQDQKAQEDFFFKAMGWKHTDNLLFQYSISQQPYFKFNTYFLFLKSFNLLEENLIDKKLSLTKYSQQLLLDNIPCHISDLDNLINMLSDDISDIRLRDILIHEYNQELMEALFEEKDFIEKINRKALANPIIIDGNRRRNKFISELAKIKVNYTCQAGTKTFKQPNGHNYVEGHHIIDFSKKGPDIIDNLLILGPTPHTLLHRGATEEIENLYNHLKTTGILTYSIFENMVKIYNCLEPEHINLLADRNLISKEQKNTLLSLIK